MKDFTLQEFAEGVQRMGKNTEVAMDDKFKDVNERFDKEFREDDLIGGDNKVWAEMIYKDIKSFIHSEISRAEKEAYLKGARGITEKLIKIAEGGELSNDMFITKRDVKQTLSELEKEQEGK